MHFYGQEGTVGFFCLRIALEEDDLLAGSAFFSRFVQRRLFPVLHLEYLAVAKEHQGCGYGLAIMGKVLETFASTVRMTRLPGMTLVTLNEKVHGFYKDLGFVPYGPASPRQKMMLPAQSVLSMVPDFSTPP